MKVEIKATVAVVLTAEESYVLKNAVASCFKSAEAIGKDSFKDSITAKRDDAILANFVKQMNISGKFHSVVADFHAEHNIEGQHE